jgi:hypothetical protein
MMTGRGETGALGENLSQYQTAIQKSNMGCLELTHFSANKIQREKT